MRHRLPGLAALTALVLAACGGSDGAKIPDAGPLPPGTKPLAREAILTPPPAGGNCYASPVRQVIYSQVEWESFWRGNNPTCPVPPVPAGVDFSRDMLVYASMGKRMTPRDTISIDASGIRNDSVIVVVRRAVLRNGCTGPRGESFPQALAKVPMDHRPVRFSEAHITIPCDAQ